MNTQQTDPNQLAVRMDRACLILDVSRSTLYRMEQDGLIHAVPDAYPKIYSVDALRKFVNRPASAGKK